MADESVTTSATKKKKKNVFKRIAKGMAIKRKKKHPDDASVMGVAMSDSVHSLANGDAGTSSPSAPIQIILLLMDPNSRRFELLQLEFDAEKALVSDVLLQIEQSATETTLRDMTYGGVCDRTGMEMIASCKLSMFCSAGKNEIVLAMPRGMGGRETAVLATPILEDEKVVEMLRPCGIHLTSKKKSRDAGAKLPKIDENEQTKAAPRSSPRGLPAEAYKKTKASYLPTQILGILIATAFIFVTQHHYKMTRPIQSGLCLMPGEWISQCGIWELFPGNKFCDSSVSKLSMGKDGKLRFFDKASNGKLEEVWSVGTECAGDDEEQCVVNLDCQGAAFTQEGKKWYVEVNGERKPLVKEAVQQFT